MISVEQIRALEERVEKALSFIASLRTEKVALEKRLETADALRLKAEARAEAAELHVLELEEAAEAFRQDQARIEEGIVHALERLDSFEDLVLRAELEAKPQAASEKIAEAASAPAAAPTPEPAAPAEKSSPSAGEAEPATVVPEASKPLEELPVVETGELDIF